MAKAPARLNLLPAGTLIGASGQGSSYGGFAAARGVVGALNCSAAPTGGAPTLDVYVQGSPDGGTTWQDVAHYQFTTAPAVVVFQVSQSAIGSTTVAAAKDGALAGAAAVQGPFGDLLRVKYVFAAGGATGTYALGATVVAAGPP